VAAQFPEVKFMKGYFFKDVSCVAGTELHIAGGSESVLRKNCYVHAPSTQYWLLQGIE